MVGNLYDQYRVTLVETATPAELVVMLYEGALRFTLRAMQAVERGDLAEAHAGFVRAQSIVVELAESLDMELGGEVAPNLMALYAYALRLLVDANRQKSTEPAAEVVALLRSLLDAWRTIVDTHAEAIPDAQRGTRAPVAVA